MTGDEKKIIDELRDIVQELKDDACSLVRGKCQKVTEEGALVTCPTLSELLQVKRRNRELDAKNKVLIVMLAEILKMQDLCFLCEQAGDDLSKCTVKPEDCLKHILEVWK